MASEIVPFSTVRLHLVARLPGQGLLFVPAALVLEGFYVRQLGACEPIRVTIVVMVYRTAVPGVFSGELISFLGRLSFL